MPQALSPQASHPPVRPQSLAHRLYTVRYAAGASKRCEGISKHVSDSKEKGAPLARQQRPHMPHSRRLVEWPCRAGIERQRLMEVGKEHLKATALCCIGQRQKITILPVLPVIQFGHSGDVVANCPDAVVVRYLTGGIERIEVCRLPIIGSWYQRTTLAGCDIAGGLDNRQVRFKGRAAVIDVVVVSCKRAGEDDRLWMQRIAVGPVFQVGGAIEACVGSDAS